MPSLHFITPQFDLLIKHSRIVSKREAIKSDIQNINQLVGVERYADIPEASLHVASINSKLSEIQANEQALKQLESSIEASNRTLVSLEAKSKYVTWAVIAAAVVFLFYLLG